MTTRDIAAKDVVAKRYVYCGGKHEYTGRACAAPLGELIGFGQVLSLPGVRVVSQPDGFKLVCATCGHGYFWGQKMFVDYELLERQVAESKAQGYAKALVMSSRRYVHEREKLMQLLAARPSKLDLPARVRDLPRAEVESDGTDVDASDLPERDFEG